MFYSDISPTGIFIGIILFSKILNYLLEKYPSKTYLIILGFILGSIAEIFPGLQKGAAIISSVFFFLMGFGIMCQVQK